MLVMLRDLVAHNGPANVALLAAIRDKAAATADVEILDLLNHVLLANRFWLVTVLDQAFDYPHESRQAASLAELSQRYEASHEQQSAWLASASDAANARTLANPLIPGEQCSVAQAFMQVCMHSHGHRAQLAKLLRRHGTVPPQTDFIGWLAQRSPAAPASS